MDGLGVTRHSNSAALNAEAEQADAVVDQPLCAQCG